MQHSAATITTAHATLPCESPLDARDSRYLREAIVWSRTASQRGNRGSGAAGLRRHDGQQPAIGDRHGRRGEVVNVRHGDQAASRRRVGRE